MNLLCILFALDSEVKRQRFVVYMSVKRSYFFVLIVLVFAFRPYCTKHTTQIPYSRQDSKPQTQQVSGRRPSTLDRLDNGIGRFETRSVQPVA